MTNPRRGEKSKVTAAKLGLGHDVFAVHVDVRARSRSRRVWHVRFVDVETGEVREVEVTPRLAAAYVKAAETHAEALEHFCGRYDIGYVQAEAEQAVRGRHTAAFRQGRFLA